MKRQSYLSAAILVAVFVFLGIGTVVLAESFSDGYAEAKANVTTPDTRIYIHDEDGSADAYAEALIGAPPSTTSQPDSNPQTAETDPSIGEASATSTASATNNSRADDDADAGIGNNSQGTATAVSSAVATDNSYSGNETVAVIDFNGIGTVDAASTAVASDNSEAGNYTTAIIEGSGVFYWVDESQPQDFGGYASGTAVAAGTATAAQNSYAGNMVLAGISQGSGNAYAEATATATNGSWAGSMIQVAVGNYGPGNIASASGWTEADNNSRAGVISGVGMSPHGLCGEFTSYGIAWADNAGESLGVSLISTENLEGDFLYGDVSFSANTYAYQPGVYFDADGGAGGVAIAIVYVESLNKATTLTFTYGIGGDAAALAVINGNEILVDALVDQGILDEFNVPGFGRG
ncbi:MAG: hypothetical protein ACRKGH_04775 [Dehalogenimonas sp.]